MRLLFERFAGAVVGMLALAFTSACAVSGSVTVQAGRVTSRLASAHSDAVRVFAAGSVPKGAVIGPVEVHGIDSQARIDRLIGMFVQKVAELGGNAAVIDAVVPRFEVTEHPRIETFSYPCAEGTCTRQHLYEANEELVVVSVRGRAFLLGGAP